MICHSRLWVERIQNNTLDEKEILDVEIFVRLDCPEKAACKLALNNLLIKRDQYKQSMDNPTIQEQDKRAQSKKKRSLIRDFFSSRF